jgi:hypothetical protein
MKKTRWGIYLNKETEDVKVDSFSTKEEAEEELRYRNSLCIAMGYTPEFMYVIKKSEM